VVITFLLPFYPWHPVGGFRIVYEYANHLVAKQHKVRVMHARWLGNNCNNVNIKECLRMKAGKLRDTFFKPNIAWQYIDPKVDLQYVSNLNKNNIPDGDVIIATSWQTAEYVLIYPLCKGRKYYLLQSYETWMGPEDRVNATWRAPIKKIVIAKWLYEKGLELGVSEYEIKYIPNGIDFNKYCLINNIENRPKRVAMLFSEYPWKGCQDGIAALELAKKDNSVLEAVLFGIYSRSKAIPDWIDYYREPRQDVLVRYIYNGSSIYLCPSLIEGWGLPSAEAMACGCAVVSTDNRGVRDYAIDGYNALLSPVNNPRRLANNLHRLINNKQLCEEIAYNGNKYIQNYTWKKAAELLEQYISILK